MNQHLEYARERLLKLGNLLLQAEDLEDADRAEVEKIQSALERCSDADLDFLSKLRDSQPDEFGFEAPADEPTGLYSDAWADANAPKDEYIDNFPTELDRFGLAEDTREYGYHSGISYRFEAGKEEHACLPLTRYGSILSAKNQATRRAKSFGLIPVSEWEAEGKQLFREFKTEFGEYRLAWIMLYP